MINYTLPQDLRDHPLDSTEWSDEDIARALAAYERDTGGECDLETFRQVLSFREET
jgi:hypothetical protein